MPPLKGIEPGQAMPAHGQLDVHGIRACLDQAQDASVLGDPCARPARHEHEGGGAQPCKATPSKTHGVEHMRIGASVGQQRMEPVIGPREARGSESRSVSRMSSFTAGAAASTSASSVRAAIAVAGPSMSASFSMTCSSATSLIIPTRASTFVSKTTSLPDSSKRRASRTRTTLIASSPAISVSARGREPGVNRPESGQLCVRHTASSGSSHAPRGAKRCVAAAAVRPKRSGRVLSRCHPLDLRSRSYEHGCTARS